MQEVVQEALQHSQRAQLLDYLRQDPAAFARLARDPAAVESLRRILLPADPGLSPPAEPELRAPSHVVIEELPSAAPSNLKPQAAAPMSTAGFAATNSALGYASVPATVAAPLAAPVSAPEPPHQRPGKRKVDFEVDQAGFQASYYSKRSKHDPLSTEPTLPNIDPMED